MAVLKRQSSVKATLGQYIGFNRQPPFLEQVSIMAILIGQSLIMAAPKGQSSVMTTLGE